MAHLNSILIEETPSVALPTGDLSAAPEEHADGIFWPRREASDDGEVPAESTRLRIGNFQPHRMDMARFVPFGSVEIHVALTLLLEDEAVRMIANLEVGTDLAFAHGVRLLV